MGLNVDIEMAVQFEEEKEVKPLGSVSIKKIWIDGDGASTIQLMSSTQYVNMDVLNSMSDHSDEDITLYFKYELED